MEAQRTRLEGSRLIVAVRWFILALALVNIWVAVAVPPSLPPPSIALYLIDVIAVLLATFRPGWGALLGAIPILVLHLPDLAANYGIEFYGAADSETVGLVVVIALGTRRVALMTVAGYLAIATFQALVRDGGPNPLNFPGLMLNWSIFLAIGLVVRLFVNRSRLAGLQIRDVEEEAKAARIHERRALEAEIGGLLTTSLATERDQLAAARSSTDPAELRSALQETSGRAREALTQLRSLVTRLRSPERSPDEGEANQRGVDSGLEQTIDSVDEMLSGQGQWVSTDLTRLEGPVGGVPAHLISGLLRQACSLMIKEGKAGDHCQITARSTDQDIEVELATSAYANTWDLTPTLQRFESAGGSARVDHGRLFASVPKTPTTITPSAPTRFDWERAARIIATTVLVVFIAVTAWHANWQDPEASLSATLSMLLFTAFLITAWWPLPGGIALGVVYVASLRLLGPYEGQGATQVDWSLFALTALLMSRRPWACLPMLPLWLLRSFVDGKFNHYWLVVHLFMWLLACLVGYVAYFFLGLRGQQIGQLAKANAKRDGASNQVRTELASELHDIVAHQLTLLSLSTDAGPDDTDLESLRAAADRSDALLESAQVDLAFLLRVLQTSEDQAASDGTLKPIGAVQTAKVAIQASGREVEISVDPALDQLDPTAQRTITRVIREGTTNILRYAPPHALCKIEASLDDQNARVKIESPLPETASTSPDSTGLGLVGLAERLRLTGGTLTSGESDGSWVLDVQLPLEKRMANA